MAESEAPSFYQHASFKKGVAEQLMETEDKKRNLEIRMIEMEEEIAGHTAETEEKNLTIQKLQQKIELIEKSMASGELMAVKSLDGMADLEAKLAFVTN